MSALILNRESFSLPDDGWYQLAPLGEFPHAESGVVQVVDREACEAMVRTFEEEAGQEPFDKLRAGNFAGALIDFDHFSLNSGSKSEAAGWITALEARESGLWAEIRWSDLGEKAVKGGRYRFLSPVWARSDCIDLGPSTSSGQATRLRPVRLLNAAVTNDPNLKGMVPLSNSRGTSVGIWDKGYGIRGQADETLRNAEGDRLLKWELGNSPDDRHCPSCSALAGQVHSAAEWEAAGLRPGAGKLFCGEHCHCRLVETDDPRRGNLSAVGPLYGDEVPNRRMQLALICERLLNRLLEDTEMEFENNWSDEARAASLAVRQAKAQRRRDSDSDGSDGDDSGAGDSDEEPSIEDVAEKLAAGEALSDAEQEVLDRARRDGNAGSRDSDPVHEENERRSEDEANQRESDRQEELERIHDYARDLESRERGGENLSGPEAEWLERYRGLNRNRRERLVGDWLRDAKQLRRRKSKNELRTSNVELPTSNGKAKSRFGDRRSCG